MNSMRLEMTTAALTAALCLLTTLSAPAGPQADAIMEVRKAFDVGEYPQALRVISKRLSLAASEPTPDEKYQLLMLRGESLLRIGERAYACDAFNAATNAAIDLRTAATAKASAVLITLSGGSGYQSAGGAGEAIPIVPQDSRARAMRAAFQDLRDRHMPAIKTALEGGTLPRCWSWFPGLATCSRWSWFRRVKPHRPRRSCARSENMPARSWTLNSAAFAGA